MTILKNIIIILFVALQYSFSATLHNDKPCCSKKCTGSEYCTACKNCSGCAYCNSGGFCGVCRPEAFKKTPIKKIVKPKAKQSVKQKVIIKKKN